MMVPYLWTALVLGVLYGVPAYFGACLVRFVLVRRWCRD